MPETYCYEYPRPALTCDVVAFALASDGLRVLLVQRGAPPYQGDWALPGGYVEMDETLDRAARRELLEETGLAPASPFRLLGVYDDLFRDPRGRTISVAFATVVRGPLLKVAGGDDASRAEWAQIGDTRPLAFDHDLILGDAVEWLALGIHLGPIALALLPDPFTNEEVRRLCKSLGMPASAARDWRESMLDAGAIEPVGRSRSTFRSMIPPWLDPDD